MASRPVELQNKNTPGIIQAWQVSESPHAVSSNLKPYNVLQFRPSFLGNFILCLLVDSAGSECIKTRRL